MKIMHLVSCSDLGDAQKPVIELLEELGRRNKIELVCFREGSVSREARERGINTRVLKKRSLIHIARNLKIYLKNKQFDLLHCHGSRANVVSMLMADVSCPRIASVYSDPWRKDRDNGGLLNRLALQRMDGCVAVSEHLKKCMLERGYDGGKMWAVYPGIRFPKKLPHRPRQEYLQSLGLDWTGDHVIFGAAAGIGQRMDTLISAFAKTLEGAPNARLLIAGPDSLEGQIRNLAAECCPAGTVHFTGEIADRNSFYHALDVNLLTSDWEAFPYTILAGAQMCCAPICTKAGSVPEMITDGRTGFLVDAGDVENLALRMRELALDSKRRTGFGCAICDSVKALFCVEVTAARQEELYRSILARKWRTEQGRDGALICGAYGKGNAGDDAILVSMIRQLRQQDPELPITVMTHDPRGTAALAGVDTVHIFNIPAVIRRMKKSRLYISGGGTLIQNATSNRSLWYYLYSIRQAKRYGCKVMMYGCGMGPVNGAENRERTGAVLNENVDLIALRDRDSMKTLEAIGVRKPEIHLTADPALLMEADSDAAWRYLQSRDLDPAGKYCLFVLRPWEGIEQRLSAICAAADYGWEKYGMMPLFCCLEPERDMEITQAAAAMVKAPSRVLEPELDGAGLCGLMERMDLVLSMRLHALIFACARHTRVAAVSYDPKVSGFMGSLGSESCVELEAVTAESMTALMDRAMSDLDQSRNVEYLKALAAQNGILAGQLLQS